MRPTLEMKAVSHRTSRTETRVRSTGCLLRGNIRSVSFQALDILVKAIDKAGYNGKIKIGMDVAASEFYDEKEKKYDLNNKEKGRPNFVRTAKQRLP